MAYPQSKFLTRLTSVIFSMLAVMYVSGQQVIFLNADPPSKTIHHHEIKWFSDKTGILPFDEIQKAAFDEFTKMDLVNSKKNWSIWGKMKLANNSGFDREYVLQTSKWGYFNAFIQQTGTAIIKVSSGSLLPLYHRSQPSNTNAISFSIQKNDTLILFVQFQAVYSIYVHKSIPLQLVQLTYFERNDRQRLLWQGLFFGIILVMALYNLFILFAVKDISYFYYVLSIVSIGLYFAFYYGFGIEYLWPRSPLWDTFCFAIINPFTGLTRILFTRTYLHTPGLMPRINWILNAMAVACIATLAAGVGCFLLNIDLLKPLVIIIGVLGALVLIMMLVAGIVAYYADKYEPAKYFIAANILLVIGAIAFILRETGLMGDNFITRYLVQYGVLIQAVILSLGLASRLNRMRLQLTNETLEKERLALEKEKEKKELIELQKLELQQQVKEKTSDLRLNNAMLEQTIGQVKESEKKLTQLNQVKDKLFSIVSHDLRNPLATMQSFLKLITEHQDKLNEEEKKKLFAEAQQSLDNLNELLYNLLQWSRSQMNLLQFKPDKLNIKGVIDNSIRMLKLHAHMKQVKVKSAVEEQLTAHADKDMAEFIVRNLLSNAIKFSYHGSEVTVKAIRENGHVKIEIADSGVGMSETTIKKLLEKNTTLTRRGTDKEKGTGLGLLISKEFIEKNGGSLSIESKPGKGSVFGFTLYAKPAVTG